MQTVAPFYENWQFWSAGAAWVALAISIAPYIIRWLKRPRLDVDTVMTAVVMHEIGHPRLQLHTILNNRGGRELRINGMSIEVRRGDGDPLRIRAAGFFQKI